MKYLNTPKLLLALFLLIKIFVDLFHDFSLINLIYFVLTISLTVTVDYIFLKIRKVKPFFLSASIVTGSIIAMLNSPKNSWLETVFIIFLAIISKHLIKIKNRHIFNPAAFGLFFGSLVLRTPVAWWSVSSVFLLLLFLPGYISIFRSRKLNMILSFFVVYNLLTFFITKTVNIFDPVILFFTLVLLPEPMTSPNPPLKQVCFGITIAVFTVLLSYLANIPDLLIGSLLIGNLLLFIFSFRDRRMFHT